MKGKEYLKYVTGLVAILIVGVFYGFTRLPQLSQSERTALASGFRFESAMLPALPGKPRNVREVNSSFYRLASWVSAIGASVALSDIDGDGLPNDLCLIDARTDTVLVAPVPSTGSRFAAFVLDPRPLPYDPRTMAPTGCMAGDFNEDGSTDLAVYYWGRAPVLFLRRAAPAESSPSAPAAGQFHAVDLLPRPEIWNTSVATQADFDGDGHVDLVFGNYFQDGARVLDADNHQPEQMQDSMSRAFNGGLKHILLSSGGSAGPEPTARFTEVKDVFEPEVAHGWSLAIGAADLDGDLLPELYIANDFGPDRLLHNRSRPGSLKFARIEGRKTLTSPTSKVVGHDSFKGMGVDFGDLNGDGILDIYVSNIANEFALQESHFAYISTGEQGKMRQGIAPYVDRSEDMGLSRSAFSWEARLADFNNDGVLEAMQATGFVRGETNRWPELQELAMAADRMIKDPRSWPRFRPGDDISGHLLNPFFVRSASGRYFDLAADVAGLGGPHVSRGIAAADVDGDGRLDFAVANQWDDSYFFRNASPRTGAFLGLHLLLPTGGELVTATREQPGLPGHDTAGRPAIGATAVVRLPDGRRLVGQIDGGNGHSGKRSPDLHFGLGSLTTAKVPVEIHWRDGGGATHRLTLELTPGWHTVTLGPEGKES